MHVTLKIIVFLKVQIMRLLMKSNVMKTIIITILVSIFVFPCMLKCKSQNIFLCIGDGMGQVQAQIADAYIREQFKDSVSFCISRIMISNHIFT